MKPLGIREYKKQKDKNYLKKMIEVCNWIPVTQIILGLQWSPEVSRLPERKFRGTSTLTYACHLIKDVTLTRW